MAQAKSSTKDAKPAGKSGTGASNPIKMANEAKVLMDEHVSLKPTIEDILAQQIAESTMVTAANYAKRREKESELDLKSVGTAPVQQNTPTPMFGMATPQPQGQNPTLAVLDKLPEDERTPFIKENKELLFQSLMGGVPGNQFLQRLVNTETNGKQPGMGEMAQVMLATTAAQSEQQRNMLQMWLTLQENQRAQQPQNNGNKEMLQAMMQMTQAIAQSNSQQMAAVQEKLLQAAEQRADMERQHAAEREQWITQMFERQIQALQTANQQRPDALTRNDLKLMLDQIRDVTGVELKPDQNADVLRARYEHEARMKELEIRAEEAKQNNALNMQAEQTKQTQLSALASALAPMAEMMMIKKKLSEGGSKDAKRLKKARTMT